MEFREFSENDLDNMRHKVLHMLFEKASRGRTWLGDGTTEVLIHEDIIQSKLAIVHLQDFSQVIEPMVFYKHIQYVASLQCFSLAENGHVAFSDREYLRKIRKRSNQIWRNWIQSIGIFASIFIGSITLYFGVIEKNENIEQRKQIQYLQEMQTTTKHQLDSLSENLKMSK